MHEYRKTWISFKCGDEKVIWDRIPPYQSFFPHVKMCPSYEYSKIFNSVHAYVQHKQIDMFQFWLGILNTHPTNQRFPKVG